MRKRTSRAAFTLMELMVVIAIIGILAFGISNINFSRLSQKQQINIEVSKIVNLIEEARNNALIGKGVDANLVTPESWSVNIENSSSGSLQVSYLSGSAIEYSSWDAPFLYSIKDIKCGTLDNLYTSTTDNTILTFTGSIGGISNGCADSDKKIKIEYGNAIFSKDITINTLSGIIEVD